MNWVRDTVLLFFGFALSIAAGLSLRVCQSMELSRAQMVGVAVGIVALCYASMALLNWAADRITARPAPQEGGTMSTPSLVSCHRCLTCGTWWAEFSDSSLSLLSTVAGRSCCDNSPMTTEEFSPIEVLRIFFDPRRELNGRSGFREGWRQAPPPANPRVISESSESAPSSAGHPPERRCDRASGRHLVDAGDTACRCVDIISYESVDSHRTVTVSLEPAFEEECRAGKEIGARLTELVEERAAEMYRALTAERITREDTLQAIVRGERRRADELQRAFDKQLARARELGGEVAGLSEELRELRLRATQVISKVSDLPLSSRTEPGFKHAIEELRDTQGRVPAALSRAYRCGELR